MIKHIVLLKFKTEDATKIAQVMSDLEKFVACNYPRTSFSFGKNCSIESFNQGFTHALLMTFPDQALRDRYVQDPEHHRIAASIIAELHHESDHPAVAVVDIEEFPPVTPRSYVTALKALVRQHPQLVKEKAEGILVQLKAFEANAHLYEKVVFIPGLPTHIVSPASDIQEARELVTQLNLR
jgi:hypothetical protein